MTDEPQIPSIKKKEDDKPFIMEIPECCREGWDSCPHVVNNEPVKVNKNIGL